MARFFVGWDAVTARDNQPRSPVNGNTSFRARSYRRRLLADWQLEKFQSRTNFSSKKMLKNGFV